MDAALPRERTYFQSLEAALADLSVPIENLPAIRAVVASLEYDTIYIPPSRSYVALVPSGGGSIVTIHSGYIDGLKRADGTRYWEELPVNRLHEGGYVRGGRDDDPGPVCPTCFMELPTSGECGTCD